MHKAVAMLAVQPRHPGDVEAGHQMLDVYLPGPLGGSIDTAWARRLQLREGRSARLVEEDHVGADVNKGRISIKAGEGHVARAEAVGGERKIRFALSFVHLRVGCGMDDHVRPEREIGRASCRERV